MPRGWPKGRPRKPRIETPAEDSLRAVEQTPPAPPPTQPAPAPALSDPPPMTVREAILAGLCEPPSHYRKALDYQLGQGPWQIIRCRECNLETYTKDPLKQDVCEECSYAVIQQLAEFESQRILRVTDRMLNPFKEGNILYELAGSLPSGKPRG